MFSVTITILFLEYYGIGLNGLVTGWAVLVLLDVES